MLCLCGCVDDCDGTPSSMFTVIKHENETLAGYGYKLMYDNDTKVVYIYIGYGYRAGLSPYYIIKDGKAEVAVYGRNYFSK